MRAEGSAFEASLRELVRQVVREELGPPTEPIRGLEVAGGGGR